jgi:hypothetical protein
MPRPTKVHDFMIDRCGHVVDTALVRVAEGGTADPADMEGLLVRARRHFDVCNTLEDTKGPLRLTVDAVAGGGDGRRAVHQRDLEVR